MNAELSAVERMLLKRPRVGFTDIYHENVRRKGLAGQLYILLFGTPHLGVFSNGLHLERVLARCKFRNVLDAGCGDGTFSFYIALKYPGCTVTGIDIGAQGLHTDESTLDICFRINKRLGLRNLDFKKADLLTLSERERYDLIFSFDVLEHIRENRTVLEKFHAALAKGGHLLFRIPSRVQQRMLSPRFTAEHERWAAVEHVGQHYDMPGIVGDLRGIGFTVVQAGFTNGFWGKLSFELTEAMKYYRFPEIIRFGTAPALKVLRRIDALLKPKQGNGMLVLCRK